MTASAPAPALSVRDVWKVFGMDPSAFARLPAEDRTPEALAAAGAVAAVQGASFDVARGEIFVIMGLSGSGKSTLLRCMTRLIEPTAGRVLLKGTDLTAADERSLRALYRREIGMVFQNFALLPNRTVLGNILFPLEVQGVAADAARERARTLIALVGLGGMEDRLPAALSGGQQQRIGIARSLATDPDFWLLDEPFSALDPLIRADLQDEVLRLQATLAKTVVFVTHDLDEAIRIADRIAIMHAGRIVQIGSAEDLVMAPASDYVERFVAKVHPARVVRARSLLSPLPDGMAGDDAVDRDAPVDSFAERVLLDEAPIPVRDGDRLVGIVDRSRAQRVLAGLRASR